MDDHWPSTDFFHSVSNCVSESGGEGEEEGRKVVKGMKVQVWACWSRVYRSLYNDQWHRSDLLLHM